MWTAFFTLVVRTGDPRADAVLEQLAAKAQDAIDRSKWSREFEDYLVVRL